MLTLFIWYSKVKKENLFAIAFGFFISAIIVFASNEFFRHKIQTGSKAYRINKNPIDKSLTKYVVPRESIQNIRPSAEDMVGNDVSEPVDASKKVSRPQPSKAVHSIMTTTSGKLIYDIVVTTDEKKRRVVEQPHSDKNNVAIILIGCSFTYGEGVNDLETFASLLSKRFKGANVYNLGWPGSGPSQIYHDMNGDEKEFYRSFKEKKLIIVNTFFDQHLYRISCNTSCYAQNEWLLDKPKYVLNAENQLEYKGSYRESMPFIFLGRIVFKSPLIVYSNFHVGNRYSEENYKLVIRIFEEIRKVYESEHEVIDFYNHFHYTSNNDVVNNLSKKMIASEITPVISSSINFWNVYGKSLAIRNDGHPSKLGHQLMAESIGWAIERDHPELLKQK